MILYFNFLGICLNFNHPHICSTSLKVCVPIGNFNRGMLSCLENKHLSPQKNNEQNVNSSFCSWCFLMLVASFVHIIPFPVLNNAGGQKDLAVWISESGTPKFKSRSLSPQAILFSSLSPSFTICKIGISFHTLFFLKAHFMKLMQCLFLPQFHCNRIFSKPLKFFVSASSLTQLDLHHLANPVCKVR